MTDDILAVARSIFEAQPFTRLLKAELHHVSAQEAEIRIAVRPELMQQHGYVHGGVLAYLADNTITFAGGVALGGDALTSEFKINYLRPAAGDLIAARATAISAGKRQAVCRCDLFAHADGERILCAAAQGTIIKRG